MRAAVLLCGAVATSLAAPLYVRDPSYPRGLVGLNETTITAVVAVRATPTSDAVVILAQRGSALPFFQTFDSAKGALLREWRTPHVASPHGLFWSPVAPGSLFVVDIANATVVELDAASNGSIMRGLIGTPGTKGAGTSPVQFSSPADAALTAGGMLLVSDGDGGSNNRVVALDRSPGKYGSVAWHVGGLGPGKGQFDSPHVRSLCSIAWPPSHTRMTPALTLLPPPPPLSTPLLPLGTRQSIAYLASLDLVIVADRGNSRLVFLSGTDGSQRGEWDSATCFGAAPAAPGTAWGIRVDATRGRAFVADGIHGAIYVLAIGGAGWSAGAPVPSCAGALLQTLPAPLPVASSKPHEMAVDEPTGDVYVACVGTPGVEHSTTLARFTLA